MQLDERKIMILLYDHGMKYKDLAAKTGLSRNVILTARNGRYPCSWKTAEKIAAALNVTPAEIIK